MQAYSVSFFSLGYSPSMAMGRPAKSKRTEFGERLVTARQQMGLSQAQVAERLGITQQSYGGWERRETALKPEHLVKVAAILNVTVDYLLGKEDSRKRSGGPVGKARRVFEEVSKLPRNQQQHIIRVVEDMLVARGVNGHRNGNS
jgi:transcriptional regulator with XRE-family HTH domain